MERQIQGVVAALLTPRDAEGKVNSAAVRANVDFVRNRGATGVCVLGATGEYPSVSELERDRMVAAARESLGSDGLLVSGAGAFRVDDSVRFARRALALGADAILLPPPALFPYEPQDVEAFYLEVAVQLDGPLLLYNLPAFTTPITPASALRIMAGAPNVVGVKDSSGKLDVLSAVRGRFGAERLVIPGNDAVIEKAIDGGLCDAVISGVAGVWPELLVDVVVSSLSEGASRTVLQEVVALVSALPTPWALRRIAEARGFATGPQPMPASPARAAQLRDLDARLEEMIPAGRRRSA